MRKIKLLLIAVLATLELSLAEEEQNNEFIEVDARKVYKDSYVKFGAGINNDFYGR